MVKKVAFIGLGGDRPPSWICPYLSVFSTVFHSGLVARSRKMIEFMLKTLLKRC